MKDSAVFPILLWLVFVALSCFPLHGNAKMTREIPAIVDVVTPALMKVHHVPGVSVALVQNHTLVWLGQYGITSAVDPGPQSATQQTSFEAASLSKPAFGYVVLQLVENGVFDLDTPLVEYLGHPYIEDEPLHEQITARMVLSHSTGFPNWREDPSLAPQFTPGTGFSYSGEGFTFLQKVIEKITGKTVERLAREKLFDPLGMNSSSYVWQKEYDQTASLGHSSSGKPPRERVFYNDPNPAYSLYTTPEDYAQFLIAMMQPAENRSLLLGDEQRSLMLEPMTSVGAKETPINRGDKNIDGPIYFGLGWRIDTTPNGLRYCHTGSNPNGFRCYTEFVPETGDGIVIMTNSTSGQGLWEGIRAAIGTKLGDHKNACEKMEIE